jgi:hypothetical protein
LCAINSPEKSSTMLQFWLIFLGILAVIFIFAALASGKKDQERKEEFKKSYASARDFDPQYFHVDSAGGSNIAIDTNAKKFALGRHGMGSKVYKYADLISVDVRRNGRSLQKTNRGSQMAGAAVGAVLLGPVGALLGGLTGSQRQEDKITELSVRLTINNESNHYHEIIFFRNSVGIDTNTDLTNKLSRQLDDWHSRLQLIMKNG